MKYVDFHVHLDLYSESQRTICSYESNYIYALFVTNLPEVYKVHYNNYKNLKYVKLALGYHPEMIEFYPFNKDIFNSYLNTTNYIGEVGIDGSKKNISTIDKQSEIFDYICSTVSNSSKIMSIHSKKAENIVIDILKRHNIKFAVFHWFSGNLKYVDDILNLGYYFSVNYNMLKTQKGKELLKNIPINKILFETDGPFTKYNGKTVSTDNFNYIYDEFNNFFGITNFKELVFNNFKSLILDRQFFELEKKSNNFLFDSTNHIISR